MSIYLSRDESTLNSFQLPEETLNRINPPQFSRHKLHLEENQKISLLINLNPSVGLYNGTKLRIIILSNSILTCSYSQGKIAYIPKVQMRYNDTTTGISILRAQFPIKTNLTETTHKAQGGSQA